MAGSCAVRFLSVVHVVAAHCKLPVALHPGLSQGVEVRTERNFTKENAAEEKDLDKWDGKERLVQRE